MNTDRLLAVAGLAIGVLGLIPIFRDSSMQVRIFYLITLSLLLALFVFIALSGRGPNYRTLLVKKVLTIRDNMGKLAEARSEQTIRVRYGILEGIWWNNLVADGSFSDPTVNGQPPAQSKKLGSNLNYYFALMPPIARGEERVIIWNIMAINSFEKDSESLLHDTKPWTKKLVMEVNFPQDRPCKNPTLHVEVAGSYVGRLADPSINGNGLQLVAEVNRPKKGHTYSLNWDW